MRGKTLLMGAMLMASGALQADDASALKQGMPGNLKDAIFAGGCFWCVEHDFKNMAGVLGAESGYTGGKTVNPTYEEVSTGKTGHREAVRVTYDSGKVSYRELVDFFVKNHDPFDQQGQFCDKGEQYKAAIYVDNDNERRIVEDVMAEVQKRYGHPLATTIEQRVQFWPAEEYHQGYSEKNPLRYKFYRANCGRDDRLDELKTK